MCMCQMVAGGVGADLSADFQSKSPFGITVKENGVKETFPS